MSSEGASEMTTARRRRIIGRMRSATPVMSEDTVLPFDLPSVARKKVSVGFDGGQLSSDAGVLLLRGVEKELGLADRLASCMRDRRDPDRIEHPLNEMLRLRMFAIAAGYEDADDCDSLRHDPIFKMAVGRLPESGEPLCSQPTMSRLENAPSKIAIARMTAALVDQFPLSSQKAVCPFGKLNALRGPRHPMPTPCAHLIGKFQTVAQSATV